MYIYIYIQYIYKCIHTVEMGISWKHTQMGTNIIETVLNNGQICYLFHPGMMMFRAKEILPMMAQQLVDFCCKCSAPFAEALLISHQVVLIFFSAYIHWLKWWIEGMI